MLRQALFRSARAAARSNVTQRTSAGRLSIPSVPITSTRIVAAACFSSSRQLLAGSGLSKQEVEGRILDLLKNFDKVTDVAKLQANSHFTNDLGLDSLDTVEVVMAIEEEFSIEIPDKEADAIHTVDKAVSYILDQPDAH